MKMLSKMRKSEKGFTLIELIVVIAILAILAAIAIPRLAGFTDNAKRSAAEAGAKTIATAMSTIFAADPTNGVATVEALDEASATLTDLTGPLTGAISDVACTEGGGIDFTYTEGGWVVVYVNSAWDSTTAE